MIRLKFVTKLFFTILLTFLAIASALAGSDSIRKNPPIIPVQTVNGIVKNASANKVDPSFEISKNMPWIGAIFIGVLTVVANLIIGRANRINSFDLLSQQIESAKEIAFRQIDQNRQNSERDFAKSVLSGNRQVWINEIRDVIAKVLATSNRVIAREKIENEQMDELWFLFAKVKLLSATYDYKEFDDTIEQMELLLMNALSGGDVFTDLKFQIGIFNTSAIRIMKQEWEKVKTGK